MTELGMAGTNVAYPDTANAERPRIRRLDRPLKGSPHPYDRLHPAMYAAEFAGTALLIGIGLSLVIALWGHDAPLSTLPLNPGSRRLLNGFLFGSLGAAIAYSPIGRVSGAHINPAMTMAFWLAKKLQWRDAVCYVLAQLAGGALGAAFLLTWGDMGASNQWAASIPASGVPIWFAVGGEMVCTFLLVLLIFAFASRPATQPFTPLVNPILFALLVWLEGPISGASANPARSFGPELISWNWVDWWVYWIGPALGVLAALLLIKLEVIGRHMPHEARLFHFGHPGGTVSQDVKG